MTFGHCGLDWLHSLLDSHKQILIMPALSFFRCWKILNAERAKNIQDMYDIWYNYINRYIGPNSKNEQKKFLHSNPEMKSFFTQFYKLLEVGGISKNAVFWAIHQAYAYAKKIDFNHKSVVVSHEHLPWPFEHILNDFPESNILMITRDPRASIAGIIYGREKDFGFLPDYTFNMIMEHWFQSQDMWNKYNNKLREKFKVVKNEDMHNDLAGKMREIAVWLGVDYSETMLTSTFATGQLAPTDSRYLKKGQEPNNLDIYYLPKNVKKRWMKVFKDRKEILMIEELLHDIFIAFQYERITKKTLTSKIKGLVYYLLPHRGLLKRWIRLYPNIEEFDKIRDRLRKTNNLIIEKTWGLIPKIFKLIIIILHSIFRRIKIYFFPGERWKRYDFPIQL